MAGERSTIAEHIGYRKPRNQTDPNQNPTSQIPSIIQSTRCKSNISSLLFSTFTNGNTSSNNDNSSNRKKNSKFRGMGCAASAQVSVPAVIRSSANWEGKKGRKKKHKKNKGMVQDVPSDVWCGPGIGFTTDAAAPVDCVVSRKPVSGRGKIDGDKINHRERSFCAARRMVNPEETSFLDDDPALGVPHPRLDVFGTRHRRHVRHSSPEGLAEIVMLQSSLMMGGRSDGLDRYRELRLDVDNMSYEQLLELGDRIGYVSTGLKEDEIIRSLRKTSISILDHLSTHFPAEMQWKCSICQEEYEEDDEMGKLDCGHYYHIHCIKKWLVQKNACPVCKTEVVSQQ